MYLEYNVNYQYIDVSDTKTSKGSREDNILLNGCSIFLII